MDGQYLIAIYPHPIVFKMHLKKVIHSILSHRILDILFKLFAFYQLISSNLIQRRGDSQMDAILNKIKGDFFSIMTPGFYILIIMVSAFISFYPGTETCFNWNGLLQIVKEWKAYWPLYLFAVFIVYLIGSFLRAIPISTADKICKLIFSGMLKKKMSKVEIQEKSAKNLVTIYYNYPFPYHPAWERLFSYLQGNCFEEGAFNLPDRKDMHASYNFFKSVLCSYVPNAFAYTQTLEARVRLFAGMFWSGLLGIAVFSMLGILHFNNLIQIVWSTTHLMIVGMSFLICVLFGGQLPRVRGQEVEYVFYSYLAYATKRCED